MEAFFINITELLYMISIGFSGELNESLNSYNTGLMKS